MPIPDQSEWGLFIPSTYDFDIQQLYSTPGITPELRELLVRLYQNVNRILLATNLKDSGYYVRQEFVNGQVFFPNPTLSSTTSTTPSGRQVYRLTINIGALGAGVTTVAHNLTIQTAWSFTRIYGAASNTTTGNFYPLPFASAGGAANIELRLNNTNVVITNNSGVTFTVCYVIVEYIKT